MNRQVEFCSHVGNLSLMRNFVRQFLGQQEGCGEEEIDLLVLGIDEACTNIIRHAYGNREDQLICLKLESLGNEGVRFRLRDYAPPAGDPASFCGRDLEDVRPGGLGVHFIQRVFDHVYYLRRRNGTELVLTRLFNHHHHAPQAAAAATAEPSPPDPTELSRAGNGQQAA